MTKGPRVQNLTIYFLNFFSILIFSLSATCFAQDEFENENEDELPKWSRPATDLENSAEDIEKAEKADEMQTASSKRVRRFHEVLDELLAEFGYDVKQGQLEKLKNISVRKISVNESLPASYNNYLELLITERIRDNSKIKVISCVPCRSRTSSIVDGKLLITSPTTNVASLDDAANQLGINYFIDAVLIYHSTHMVLALQAFDTATKEQVWARTYNSETVKSRYQKLAIDYSQVAKARPGEEYQPEYKFLLGLGGAGVPNIGGSSDDSRMLSLEFRATERFNNRRSEFGLMLNVFSALSSIAKTKAPEEEVAEDEDAPAEAEPFTTAIAFNAIYAHNFFGALESYNDIRYGMHAGVGAILATGYLAPVMRAGWDAYFGRRFVSTLGLFYLSSSSVLVEDETVKTKGGVGGELVISYSL
ncbi:MAG: hypothetical protein KBD78_13880 [Oligoflexales bacterium]|nr:hypothetical protein [Oligoflexales bacterium]